MHFGSDFTDGDCTYMYDIILYALAARIDEWMSSERRAEITAWIQHRKHTLSARSQPFPFHTMQPVALTASNISLHGVSGF